ncbi:flippase-like domain-containing protein [Corynebacterium poyangense]|uniref:Flippase-like domain-containing protein n=1 Tax=Corynebacterium poyangense TaxID=2684405 RepID=A0A7H0SRM2_9CORY|nr:YbhN family protein [Corynebacterium poyangense]QNQ91197.1 flippase-like domain-containing protein [Corynebacterium poyangense]
MQASKRKIITWTISLFALLCIYIAFRKQLGFIEEGIATLGQVSPLKILLVFLFIALALVAMAEVMYLLLENGAPRMRRRDTTRLSFAANAWATTLPGGPAFAAVFSFHVQRSWGASVVLSSWFIVLSGVLSSMWLAVLGLLGVFLLGAHLSLASLFSTLALMFAVAAAVFYISRNPEFLAHGVIALITRFNKLTRAPANRWVDTVRHQILQLRSVELSPTRFSLAAFWSLMNWVFDILGLWASVWAITGSLPWLEPEPDSTTLVGVVLAFVTAKIAGTAQVTPGGLGTVEAALVGTLVATGMTATTATGAVIIYRLISFIAITVIGWVIYVIHYARSGFKPTRRLSSKS